MNSNQIKKVKELCEKSAEGPWEMGAVFHQNTPDKIEARHIHSAKEWIAYNVSEYNGKFIVEARELLPLAIAEIERLREGLEEISVDTNDRDSDIDAYNNLREKVRQLLEDKK